MRNSKKQELIKAIEAFNYAKYPKTAYYHNLYLDSLTVTELEERISSLF